jgi:hypothetical protein
MATAAKILDQQRFEARARVVDVLALGLVFIVGFFLMVEMYRLGFALSQAGTTGGQSVAARDARWVVVGVEGCILVASMLWVSYRLFSGRRLG